ncbi:hypothetical protein Acor_50450 [Acrocarpospora corrugata]|uniref:Uncharacterized protein n=1 Tax=Acrocarpospora corrugata TaxID=35763 RepID=A0A5M3W3W9_9ACTN|nr:hypothetical protein Acor_50450 [Acrocarpospora corrugata]
MHVGAVVEVTDADRAELDGVEPGRQQVRIPGQVQPVRAEYFGDLAADLVEVGAGEDGTIAEEHTR